MNKLRWGVLGTAKIAIEKVIPAMKKSRYSDVIGIASRSRAAAESAAERLGLPLAFGSYEQMLAHPDLDAIYVPLPNHLHVPWTMRALTAGKHVLCEKPIAMNAHEAGSLVEFAKARPERSVMEAFMYRFHPQWQLATAAVASGRLGELRAIQTLFSYHNVDPDNIRNQADIGGGALMDIGCYAISLSRLLFAREPERVLGITERDPRFGTDRLASGILDFGSGTASFTCSTQLAAYQRVHVLGDRGRLEIEIPFNAPTDRPCSVFIDADGKREETSFEADQYTLEVDAFSQAVLEHRPAPTPLEDAARNMSVIDAVRGSAARGTWAGVA